MTDTGSLNLRWSHTLIAGFCAAGVQDAVISPGSRSTPLALALLRQPAIRSHVVVDERCAAFFALGLAKASGRPTLIVATSGTAPANWYPAIIEASQTGVPLLLISADRPPELQDCGANQTIDQTRLFGAHVRASHLLGLPDDTVPAGYLHRLAAHCHEQATWPLPGPVHLNQPFREPLVTDSDEGVDIPAAIINHSPTSQPDVGDIVALAQSIAGRPGVIVCGEMPARPGQSEAIIDLAERLACPILAEPLSGLRFGSHDRSRVATRYGRWLAQADTPRPEWIIRFGAFPLTRQLQQFLGQPVETHALIEPWPRWSDPAHRLTHHLRGEPPAVCRALIGQTPEPCPAGWSEQFAELEMHFPAVADNPLAVIVGELPADGALFVGNSLAIRELDHHASGAAHPLNLYANRGASGIDGNISTAMGIAAQHGHGVAVIGDLTAQHDLGGLALAQGRDVVIVVLNNGGGGIFAHLPQRQLPEFEQGWLTPQAVSFAHAAGTFGLQYACARSSDELRQALRSAQSTGGSWLVEMCLDISEPVASR